jgi:hypothetical protein
MNTIISILFPIIIIVLIIDIALSVVWHRFYYSSGICVYRRTIPFKTKRTFFSIAELIESRINDQIDTNPFIFGIVDDNTFGIREKLLSFGFAKTSYTPIMHGSLFYDEQNQIIVFRGLLNWFSFGFPVLWYSLIFSVPFHVKNTIFIIFIIAPLVVYTFIYLLQSRRYDKITELIEIEILKN